MGFERQFVTFKFKSIILNGVHGCVWGEFTQARCKACTCLEIKMPVDDATWTYLEKTTYFSQVSNKEMYNTWICICMSCHYPIYIEIYIYLTSNDLFCSKTKRVHYLHSCIHLTHLLLLVSLSVSGSTHPRLPKNGLGYLKVKASNPTSIFCILRRRIMTRDLPQLVPPLDQTQIACTTTATKTKMLNVWINKAKGKN